MNHLRTYKLFEASNRALDFKYRKNNLLDQLKDILDELKDEGIETKCYFENWQLTKLQITIEQTAKYMTPEKFRETGLSVNVISDKLYQIEKFLNTENFKLVDIYGLRRKLGLEEFFYHESLLPISLVQAVEKWRKRQENLYPKIETIILSFQLYSEEERFDVKIF